MSIVKNGVPKYKLLNPSPIHLSPYSKKIDKGTKPILHDKKIMLSFYYEYRDLHVLSTYLNIYKININFIK